MYISAFDLFDALKPSMGEANAKAFVSKLEQQVNMVDVKIERVAVAADLKIEKAFEMHAKVYKEEIKGLKELMEDKFKDLEEFMDDKFASKEDLANSMADIKKWIFISWLGIVLPLMGMFVAIYLKMK